MESLQESGEEDGGDAEFALQGHLEFPDDSLGEEEGQEVGDGVEDAGGDVDCCCAIAVPGGDENVPVLLARTAEEELGEDVRDVETEVEPDEKVSAPVHQISLLNGWKDLQVLKED